MVGRRRYAGLGEVRDFPAVELLAILPPEHARRVLSGARRRRFKRNELIFREGDLADSLHLIAIGRVAVRVSTALGHTATLDVVGVGGVIGEQALLPSGGARSATVVALERTETMQLGAAIFADLRREHPSIDEFLLGVLASRNRALTARLIEALYVPTETRVVRRLVELADLFSGSDGGEIVITLTQDDLAGLAGTTRETVNRVLRVEADLGTVALARGRFSVLDRDALVKRAQRH